MRDFQNVCLRAIHESKATELLIHISSVGGGLHQGFTLYHFLKSIPVKTTVTNAGSIESAAVLFYLGGNIRLVSPMARFAFHPWTWDFGAGPRQIPVIKEALHSLEADMDRFVNMVETATKGAAKTFDVRSTFTTAVALDAKAAIEYGVANEVKDSVTPTGCPIWWINDVNRN